MKSAMNIQDSFLNQARKENIPVTIFLTSGMSLKGIIRGFDSFCIILDQMPKPNILVYKHAVISVVPSKYIKCIPDIDNKSTELL